MAGVVRARQRVEELCDTFSARTVKATMYKLIDDSERVCRGRLQNVPDGRWRDEIYVGGAFAGDTDLHRTVLTLEKRGDRLTFSNAGTDRQIGSLNCGYGVWRAAIGCALGHMLAYDHKYCLAGVLRCCSFDAEVGTITCADRDGAYSTIYGQTISLFMAEKVIGKMLFPDPTQRTSILATSGLSSAGWMTHWGPDQWTGAMTATVTLDHGAAGLGAFPLKDGVDQGGTTLWPKSEIPDVEAWERYFPVLYLYRRAARNAGHGKFRGGNGISFALIGHGDQDQAWSAINMTPSTTTQSGLFGGHWGATSLYYGVTDSNIRELFSEGTMPASQQELAELSGTGGRVPAKTMGMRLGRRDVAAKAVFGGGGYGDALEREPDAVAQDLYDDVISLRTAADVYGVVIDEGIVDVDATRTRRATMRRSLLERAVMPATASARTVVAVADGLQIAEVLTVVAHLGRPTIACLNCESALCDIRENYKDHCARVDSALTEVNPEEYVDPSEDGLEHTGLGYRAYLCPHCGVCFERELAPARAAPVWDIAITEASLERFLRPAR
jgi:N-methylhydantoinase B